MSNYDKPYTISKNQGCKMVALLKSLKNIYVLIFRIHILESIFKSNKHIYKIRYQNLKLKDFIATYIQLRLIGIGASKEHIYLNSLSATDFSCKFNDGFRFLINSASAIFCFRLLQQ